MSVLGHVAIGVVTARRITPERDGFDALAARMAGLAALALLPDSDFVLHVLFPGVDALDHRGATHSLAVAAFIGLSVAFALVAARADHPLRWGVLAALVVASHGLMDIIGDSSLGVELFWPFSDVRVLAPWQLLPDPSLTPPLTRNFLGAMLAEAVLFIPAWLYAFLPRAFLRRLRQAG
jgi:inner membrane protein